MPSRSQRQRRSERRHKLNASGTPHSFHLCDESAEVVRLEAAAASDGDSGSKLRRFAMTAYTGGKMMLNGFFYPVVVDLSGLKVSAKARPILRDHDPSQIVGHTDEISINGSSIFVKGVVSAANQHAMEVAASADNGFPWQASIGAVAKRMVLVDEKETVEVNGRKFTGPLYVARQSVLGEVSFVALGADDNTSARMAAAAANAQEGILTMKFEQWLQARKFDVESLDDNTVTALRGMFDQEIAAGEQKPEATSGSTARFAAALATHPTMGTDGASTDGSIEAVRREGARIAQIQACAAKHPELMAKAIEEGWSPRDAAREVELKELRAGRPTAPNQSAGHAPVDGAVLRAAMYQAVGINEDDATKELGEPTMQAAHEQYRGRLSLQQAILEAAWSNGYTGRQFQADSRDMIKAAFSTMTLTSIFADVANKQLLSGFESNDDLAVMRAISAISSVSDFKQINSYRLGANMTYQQVGPTGELKHGSLNETAYTNQAKTYGVMYSITRTDIINDDLNALDRIPFEIGVGGSDKLLDVFWTAFLDNSTFFASGNNNYVSGSSTVLGVDSLTTVDTLFLNQTKPNGKPLGTRPAILLVPPALNTTAKLLMTSMEVRDTTASTKAPTQNPHVGRFAVLTSPYLSNSSYTGYSTTAWYLLAEPSRMPVIETVFLNGQQSPTVESADASFNVLGVEMRGYHDFGVTKQEYRGGAKSKGAA